MTVPRCTPLAESHPAEALRLDARALAIAERALGPAHPDLADPLTSLARAQLAVGDVAAARTAAERATTLRLDSETMPTKLAESRFVLAQALWAAHERPRALALAAQAGEQYARIGAPRKKELAEVEGWLRPRRAAAR